MDLATFARSRREALGLTQEQVAEYLGVKRTYYLGIELGDNKLPRAEIRRKLASCLGVRHLDILLAAGQLEEYEIAETLPVSPRAAYFAPYVDGVDDQGLEILRSIAAQLRRYLVAGKGGGSPSVLRDKMQEKRESA